MISNRGDLISFVYYFLSKSVKLDPAIISMQPTAGVVPMPGEGIVSSSHSASSSTLIDQSSGDVIDLLMSAASKSSLNVGDDINNSTEPTDSNKAEAEEEGEEETSTHINPYNPDGKSYLYSIEFVIALRDSPLCKTPESFILPDISVYVSLLDCITAISLTF